MGLFALARSGFFPRKKARWSARLAALPLSPCRLERRRVLDASAASLLLGPAGGTGDFVQVGENFENPPQVQSFQATDEVARVNVPPENLQILPFSDINENKFARLTLTFDDPNDLDPHMVEIDWGDGTPIEMINLAGGSNSVTTAHQYFDDNPTATPVDINQVQVTVTDSHGAQTSLTEPIQVSNVAPIISNLTVSSPVNENGFATLDLTFADPGLFDTHSVKIDWGDGSPVDMIDLAGGSRNLMTSHQYLDDNPSGTSSDTYTVSITLHDDDTGAVMATREVVVNNLVPSVTINGAPMTSPEGTQISLTGSAVDTGTQDTFTSFDWQVTKDGNFFASGNGVAFDFTPDDNGLYVVTLMVTDDDLGIGMDQVEINVENVAPTLVLTDRMLELNEGETLDLFDLGTFTDPGFNGPMGGTVESFSYTINWGDGTIDTGQLPATVVDGGPGVLTSGTLANSHFYADNDSDNHYTITVTLSDDDGGSHVQEIGVTVFNVNPTLDPIAATDVNTLGQTTLDLTFTDPGADVFFVLVDWGDKLALPPDARFVLEVVTSGATPLSFTIGHQYFGPPEPLHPAADIIITVKIRDDDFGTPLVIEVGQSNLESVAISNPGEGITPVRIDTTPQVPRLVFPREVESGLFFQASTSAELSTGGFDLSAAASDSQATTERFLELRTIDAYGLQSAGYRLKSEVLKDLPGLFRKLPDNHYAIYLVRMETNTRRLVIEVYVRNGKLIDPGDDSEGTRDRPPTDESAREQEPEQLPEDVSEPEALKELRRALKTESQEGNEILIEPLSNGKADRSSLAPLVPLAVGLAGTHSFREWARQVDRAVSQAGPKKWRELRRRRPQMRKNR